MMTKALFLCSVIMGGCDGFRLNKVLSYRYAPLLRATTEYPSASTLERTDELMTRAPFINDAELEEKERELGKPTGSIRIGSQPVISVEGDSTETTPSQRAALAAHFAMVLLNVIVAFNHVDSDSNPFVYVSIFIASILLGDLGTGVFHWSVDNYGSINTPIVGTVCAAFQGHHDTPWTITFRSFANNVYKICYVTVPVMIALYFAHPGPQTQMFMVLFINWWMLSQEFHKYSHMKKPPAMIKFLQDNNLILSRKEHGRHHNSPFEGNYCILTGIMNPLLDRSHFFRHLERIVYRLTGNVPNTWKADEGLKDVGV